MGLSSAAAQERRATEQDGQGDAPAKKSRKKRKKAVAQPPLVPQIPLTIWAPNPASTLATKPAKSPASKPAPPQDDKPVIKSTSIEPVSTTVVNLRELEATEKSRPADLSKETGIVIHPPMTLDDSTSGPATPVAGAQPQAPDEIPEPKVPSPNPTSQFQGEIDQAKVGTGTFTIPPDTMGAVGLDKVFVTLNNNYKIQDKTTGAQLSLVSIDTFWASTGATGVFDPRVQYDPYNDRWLVAATSNAQTANSSVLVGVSATSDPQGSWTLFRFIVGCAPGAIGCNAQGEWSDFPMLGFNKNWVAVGWNQFTINTSAFTDGRMLALDYPALRGGISSATLFSGASAAIGGFCMHPATTFSATEETLYIPTHISSAGATYRLHRITGTPGAPIFNVDPANRTRTGGGWTQPGGDILPQQCIPGVGLPTQTCPATIRKIDSNDAFIRSNVIFRNGKIYYPQTIALPAGGINSNSRTAAQWTVLNPDGTFFDGGRVDDPTATATNGGKWYAYPSIGVNKNNDVLLGFSEFESDDYVDAGYTFRLSTDAAGTMRDPAIYKEGEDYYAKTFSGTRNRWGDYSHTVVDPSNDSDLWTIQEYAMLRVGTTGEGTNDSRWGTWWAKVSATAGAGDLLISEFRLHGPNGPGSPNPAEPNNDEYIEIYNNNNSAHVVTTIDGSAGYGIAASDGEVRCVIPNATVIPGRGHYLCANSNGYSLSNYPSGNGTTATGDGFYTSNIPANTGIAIFNTALPVNFSTTTRIDAVGPTTEANALFKEGAGIPAITPFATEYAFMRTLCPSNTPTAGTALGCFAGSGGRPKDSNDNSADFIFVDTGGLSIGAGQRLGTPGPENLSSPIERNTGFSGALLDATVTQSSTPNRVRDSTSDPGSSSTFGTLDLRRRIVNNTGAPVTRLRFRIIDLTSFPSTAGIADLRGRTSTAVVVNGINDAGTCPGGITPCTVTVEGTTLESPPAQPNFGAFNSSLSADTITLAAPLAPGASINVRFLLGVQQTGAFRFYVNIEALP